MSRSESDRADDEEDAVVASSWWTWPRLFWLTWAAACVYVGADQSEKLLDATKAAVEVSDAGSVDDNYWAAYQADAGVYSFAVDPQPRDTFLDIIRIESERSTNIATVKCDGPFSLPDGEVRVLENGCVLAIEPGFTAMDALAVVVLSYMQPTYPILYTEVE